MDLVISLLPCDRFAKAYKCSSRTCASAFGLRHKIKSQIGGTDDGAEIRGRSANAPSLGSFKASAAVHADQKTNLFWPASNLGRNDGSRPCTSSRNGNSKYR